MSAPQIDIKQIVALLGGLPEKHVEQLRGIAAQVVRSQAWIPNPGPQTKAYNCTADQVLYGGAAGGGKTDLLIGLATQKHRRSLILRRMNKEVLYLAQRTEEIVGHKEGYNGQDKIWRMPDGRFLQFGGCQHPGDERGYKGQPKDFIGIDEASEFLESQIEFVIQWLRTADPKQHCQLVLATNPPDSADGEWLIRWFGPWIDPEHPMYGTIGDGELLYYRNLPDKEIQWSYEPFEYEVEVGGVRKMVRALSRTFIRSFLADNPDYAESDYAARLENAPEELKRRYAKGEFIGEPRDDEFQVIPTLWVMAAQDRWKAMGGRPQAGHAMTAMGVDIAQGGADRTVLSPRYGEFFSELIVKKGTETPTGAAAAGVILMNMRDGAQINLDCGGGWGNSCYEFLANNDACSVLAFVGSMGSMAKSRDGKLKFKNKRAESWWSLREALDPMSGFEIALPPDPELKQELTVVKWQLMPGAVIQIEEKSEIKKKLGGRSPDKSDAVVLAWFSGKHRVRPVGASRAKNSSHGLQTRTNEGYRVKRYDRYARRSKEQSRGPVGGSEQG